LADARVSSVVPAGLTVHRRRPGGERWRRQWTAWRDSRMSDGRRYVAKCWSCGWVSESSEAADVAELWAGWHALAAGCPVGRVRALRTSEVEP
jgi:hypothetical protein